MIQLIVILVFGSVGLMLLFSRASQYWLQRRLAIYTVPPVRPAELRHSAQRTRLLRGAISRFVSA